jgi:DNA-binding transcriptional LysR family regulator
MELDTLRIFVKVAELASFTRAGEQLGLSKARVSQSLRALEDELGSTLLSRTTRAVRPTPDGEHLLVRARRLLVEADEVSSMFQAARALRGRVRIDLPAIFARDVIIPRLPDFLAAHPQIELLISTTDRRVDVVREGFDCVLRVGALGDSGLVARRLGLLPMVNCASPAYLKKHGTPSRIEDLEGHVVVHYSLALAGDPPSFEYVEEGRRIDKPMRSVVTVNSADAYLAACVAGLGIIQVPRSGKSALFADGKIAEILPKHTAEPMPVSLLHAHGRSVPKRVRAVMTWLADTLEPHVRAQ